MSPFPTAGAVGYLYAAPPGLTARRFSGILSSGVMYILALALLVFCFTVPLSVQAQQVAPPPGDVSLKLKGLDGKIYDLEEMRGQALLVSFGASWCRPCEAELRALEELKREYKDRPLRFFWVSIEREDEITDSKLRSFAKAQGLSFTVLRDPAGMIYAQFSTRRRIPLVIFINREGQLVLPQHTGMAEPELYKRTIRERLDRLLQPSAPAATSGAQ